MGVDSRLDILPTFQVRSISPGGETTLVVGCFNRPEQVSVGDRGWLFVSETDSSIGDIVTLDGDGAGIAVPNWSMTRHVDVDAILPWLDAKWQARDLAFLLDDTKEWRRVEYRPTDAIVFAKRTLRNTSSSEPRDIIERSCATESSATTRPRCRTMTLVHSFSTTSRTWEL